MPNLSLVTRCSQKNQSSRPWLQYPSSPGEDAVQSHFEGFWYQHVGIALPHKCPDPESSSMPLGTHKRFHRNRYTVYPSLMMYFRQ